MSNFFSSFCKLLPAEIFELVQPGASKFIYRDELCKKQSPNKLKNRHEDSFTSTKPLIIVHKDDEKDHVKRSSEAKTTIRVKVKMTKQEAARLLSKCKNGGVLEFRDVARELVHLSPDRVNVVTPNNSALDSIPEEY